MPPTRTCLGCRQRAEKGELVRIVARDKRLVSDPAQRLPGRGAYLHPGADCLAKAVKRRAFGRALRRPGLDPSLQGFDLLTGEPRLGESGGAS